MEFDGFLQSVEPLHREFVQNIHENLTGARCKVKIESKAAGCLVSYTHPVTKKSMLNFFFRKSGLHVRFYPSQGFTPSGLTDEMISETDKQPDCKRLTKTAGCNPKCQTGYEFDLAGKRCQKCRLCAFQYLVTAGSKPVITKWIEEECIKN